VSLLGDPTFGKNLSPPTSRCSVIQLLDTSHVFPSWPILFTLMMEATCSSERSVLTRPTRRHIPKMTFFVLTVKSYREMEFSFVQVVKTDLVRGN
jgi:hypothetical protein